jgi:hypothetical protein
VTRRRVKTYRTASLDRVSLEALDRAAFHGFDDVILGFDTREWLADVFRVNRRRLVQRFLDRELLLGAFPVAEFEVDDPQLRTHAQQVLAAERERWHVDPRELLL